MKYKLDEAMSDGVLEEDDFIEFKQRAKTIQQGDRYYGMNLLNLNSKRDTIEFRVANGTTNPDVWIENIRLFGRLMEKSEELAQIELKEKNGVTLKRNEAHLLKLKKKIQDKSLSEEEKSEVLIELLFNKEERQVYRDRYTVNSMLQQDEMAEDFEMGVRLRINRKR